MNNLEIKETTKNDFFAEVDNQKERDPMPAEITFLKKNNFVVSSETIWRFKDRAFFGCTKRDKTNSTTKYYLAK